MVSIRCEPSQAVSRCTAQWLILEDATKLGVF